MAESSQNKNLAALPANSPLAQLQWVSETELGVDWQDGHASVYTLSYLRKSCPCAVCQEEDVHTLGLRRGIRLRPRPSASEDVRALMIQPIGRYAIQLVWSDGHRAGIYSYDYLRKICPCRQCKVKIER
jgi:DUF971 family protein